MDKASGLGKKKVSRRDFLKATAGTAAGLATAGLAASLGWGCGPAAPAGVKKEEEELHFLQWVHFVNPADVEFDRQVAEWTKAKGVRVKVERIGGGDMQSRMAAAVQTKTGPDIIQLQSTWAWLYADSLVDLNDVAEEAGKVVGGFYPDITEATKVKDVWKAIPYYYYTNTFAYRTDWFKEAGATVPKTWDDFIAEGKKLKKYGKPFGQAMGHSEADPYTFWYPWLWAYGGKEVEADGKTVAINSPQTLEAVEKSIDLFDNVWAPGVLSWDDASNNRAYLAEQLSCSLNGASIYFVAKKDFPDIAKNTDHFAHPAGPSGRFVYSATAHLSLMSYSKNQDAAKDFIRYLTNAENINKYVGVQEGFAQGTGPKMEEHPVWKTDPKILAFLDVIKSKIGRWPGYAGPPSAQATQAQVRFIIVDLFAKACSREFKPKEAIAWAETQLKGIYK